VRIQTQFAAARAFARVVERCYPSRMARPRNVAWLVVSFACALTVTLACGASSPETNGGTSSPPDAADVVEDDGGRSDGPYADGSAEGDGSGGSAGTGGGDADREPVVCSGTYDITSREEFLAFTALECTTVTGSLRIRQTELTSLDGLMLTEVQMALFVAANPALASLSGLESIGSIGGDLVIVENVMLTSLSPLASWAPDTVAGDLSIFNNVTLPQCEVDNLDAHLTAACSNCASNGDGTCD